MLVLCLTRVPPVPCRDLNTNQLSGTIPSSLGSANNLHYLYVIGVGIWLYGCAVVLMHGCVGVWGHGYMGVWAYNCMDVRVDGVRIYGWMDA